MEKVEKDRVVLCVFSQSTGLTTKSLPNAVLMIHCIHRMKQKTQMMVHI